MPVARLPYPDLARAAVILVAAALMALPLFLTDLPPLGDYPQHLARAYILNHLGQSPDLAAVFEVKSGVVPYFAWDAIAVPLTRLFGTYRGGQAALVLVFVLLTASTLSLHWALRGGIAWESATVLLVLYSTSLAWGNVTYLPGLAVAIFAFAGWIAARDWPIVRRLAVFTVAGAVVFLSHLLAWGVFGLLIGSYELGRSWRGGAGSVLRAGLIAGVPLLSGLALWPLVNSGLRGPTNFFPISHHLMSLLSPLGFNLWLEHSFTAGGVTDLVLIVAVLVSLYAAVRSGRLDLAAELRWPLVLGGVAALAVPVVLWGVWGLHLRLPMALACLLAAGIRIRWPSRRIGLAAGLGLGALLVLRLGVVSQQMAGCAAPVAEIRAALALLPAGARLLTVVDEEADGQCRPARGFLHVAMLATIDRGLYVPTFFQDTTIVRVRPPHPHDAAVLLPAELRDAGAGTRAANWRQDYTHVLWAHFGRPVEPLPDTVTLLRESPTFNLYAVDPRQP